MTGPCRDRSGSKRVCGFGFGLAREPQEEQWSVSQQFVGGPQYCLWGEGMCVHAFLVGSARFFFMFHNMFDLGSIRVQRTPALLSLAFGRGPSNRQWRQNCCARTRAHTHTHTHALCPCRAHPPKKSKSIVNDQHKCARASQTMRAHARAQPVGGIIVVVIIIIIVVVFRRSCVRVWVHHPATMKFRRKRQ